MGRLRAVRAYLNSIEGPEGTLSGGLKTFHLKYARPEEVLAILRQLLEVPEDKNAAADGSIRISQDTGTDRLYVSGRPDKVARASEIIEKLDMPHARHRPARPRPYAANERRVCAGGLAARRAGLVDHAAEPDSHHQPTGRQRFDPRGRRCRIASPIRSAARCESVGRTEANPAPARPATGGSAAAEAQEGPKAEPPARVTMAADGRPGKLFGARIFFVADPVPPKAAVDGNFPPRGTEVARPDYRDPRPQWFDDHFR